MGRAPVVQAVIESEIDEGKMRQPPFDSVQQDRLSCAIFFDLKSEERIYLGLVYFICYGLGALELAAGTGRFYRILGVAFTFLPVVMSLITRRVTGRKGMFHLSFRVWKNARGHIFRSEIRGDTRANRFPRLIQVIVPAA